MKVCFLAYDHFAIHSTALLTYFLREFNVQIVYCSEKAGPVSTKEGLTVLAETDAASVRPADYSGIIVPGGLSSGCVHTPWIMKLLQAFCEENTLICSICEGTILLAHSGVLARKRYTSSYDLSSIDAAKTGVNVKQTVIADENLITARGQSFTEFALVCLKAFGCADSTELWKLKLRYKPPRFKITWGLKKYGDY